MKRYLWVVEYQIGDEWHVYSMYKTQAGATSYCLACQRNLGGEYRVTKYTPAE